MPKKRKKPEPHQNISLSGQGKPKGKTHYAGICHVARRAVEDHQELIAFRKAHNEWDLI